MSEKIEGGLRLQGTQRSSLPLVSIITVVFRARQNLPELLESVFRLKEETTELIVVDGGSEDGTCDLLRQYNSQIDYWVSEPDRGIYDAMNKGIALARGIYIFHLNAGDRLLSVPVRELTVAIGNGIDIAAFRVSIDGKYEFRPARGIALRLNNTIHHQGTFFRRQAFPPYDTRYRVFADFDVNQRMARQGARIQIFDQVVALHASGGISDIATGATISEFFQVIKKNYGPLYLPLAWFLCKWRALTSRLRVT
jgi:glycosyltransferase involved in cell wall biosynthesis